MSLWWVLDHAVVAATFCWIVWVVFGSLRGYMVSKSNNALQEKLFQRIDSTEALLALTEKDSGRRFLESISMDRAAPTSPFNRILSGLQVGIVLLFFGIAMLSLHHFTSDREAGFIIFGTCAIGLGVGFLVASAASIFISRRLGLLDLDRRS